MYSFASLRNRQTVFGGRRARVELTKRARPAVGLRHTQRRETARARTVQVTGGRRGAGRGARALLMNINGSTGPGRASITRPPTELISIIRVISIVLGTTPTPNGFPTAASPSLFGENLMRPQKLTRRGEYSNVTKAGRGRRPRRVLIGPLADNTLNGGFSTTKAFSEENCGTLFSEINFILGSASTAGYNLEQPVARAVTFYRTFWALSCYFKRFEHETAPSMESFSKED
ncbi:hypothetical protein EVAR_94492_1 [Eumeta japonica]|uniref:Uncharacterized protein n=1 Tax=Eumeta variegata TaxID=151549 RepID=A0A4C1UWL7_EUMVA|nr:hypothetical protein EVAR_94492_1 [Eumeta japonica]